MSWMLSGSGREASSSRIRVPSRQSWASRAFQSRQMAHNFSHIVAMNGATSSEKRWMLTKTTKATIMIAVFLKLAQSWSTTLPDLAKLEVRTGAISRTGWLERNAWLGSEVGGSLGKQNSAPNGG
jgi:hypothetical protein